MQAITPSNALYKKTSAKQQGLEIIFKALSRSSVLHLLVNLLQPQPKVQPAPGLATLAVACRPKEEFKCRASLEKWNGDKPRCNNDNEVAAPPIVIFRHQARMLSVIV